MRLSEGLKIYHTKNATNFVIRELVEFETFIFNTRLQSMRTNIHRNANFRMSLESDRRTKWTLS